MNGETSSRRPDAYHDHDLDRCLGHYAPDVVVKDADRNVLMDGAEAARARYARSMTDHPNIHHDIPNRIALGDYVIDEERVTGFVRTGGPVPLARCWSIDSGAN